MSERQLSDRLIGAAIGLFEQAPLPDAVTRVAARALLARTSARLAAADASETARFARAMEALPIAVYTGAANAQHYEVPAYFFALTLGPQRKYSCCLYESPGTTLAEAEEAALAESARRAGLADGQRVLELGCGWGSMSLWMARRFPASRITAVSNSTAQRETIERLAKAEGLRNLEVVTADINVFAPEGRFDRVISIEMFEHMSNWSALFARVASWLAPDGRLFLHVFTHRATPYRFDHADASDWIGKHFFTGGVMPSEALASAFPDTLSVETKWRWSGAHYARTAEDWLANFDRNEDAIRAIFDDAYGAAAQLWMRRWRLFFIAVAELFGYANGDEWGVNHYLMKRPTKD